MGEWREALSSPTHARAERSLVAQTLSPDLFDHAKDLFMGAKQVGRAMLTPFLNRQGIGHQRPLGRPRSVLRGLPLLSA